MKIRSVLRKATIALAVVALVIAAAAVVILASDEGIKPSGVSVSTAGEIRLDFYYASLGSAENVKVEISGTEGDEKVYSLADLSQDSKNRYVVSAHLAPSQMTAKVTVTLMKNGVQTSTPVSYSVADYAKANMAKNPTSAPKMKALLNWGAMAQGLHSINTDDLANAGMFARGTNAIDEITSISHNAAKATTTNTVTGFAREVILAPEGITFKLYFNCNETDPSKVTISREGMAATAVEVKEYSGEEEYTHYVEIKNLGARHYNTQYTLSVEAGGETATYTTNALEYFSALLAGGNDTQKNVAKAMYHYYGLVENTIDVDTCEHNGRAHFEPDGETKSHYACSKCFETLSGAVSNDINWIANIYESKETAKFTVKTDEDGTIYRNYSYDAGTAQALYLANEYAITGTTMSSRPVKLGNYVVIKYRTSQHQTLKLGVGTSEDSRANVGDTISAANQSTGWQTALVDVSSAGSAKGWTAGETTNAQIRFTTTAGTEGESAYIDVALVAIVDSPEEARTLLADDETYFDRGTAFNATGVELDKDGKCPGGAHTVALSKADNDDGTTTYSYSCSACKEFFSSETGKGLDYYHDITVRQDTVHNPGIFTIGEDEVAYIKYEGLVADSSVGVNVRLQGTETIASVGKFLVIKYQSTTTNGSMDVYVSNKRSGGNAVTKMGVINSSTNSSETWRTAVIDMSGVTVWPTGTENTVYLNFRPVSSSAASTLNIAMFAVASTEEAATSFLLPGETYYYYAGGEGVTAPLTNSGEIRTVTSECVEHVSEVVPAVAPTCTETGLTEGSRCSVCHEVLVKQEEVSATGHTWGADNKCTVCGEPNTCECPTVEQVRSGNTVVFKCSDCGVVKETRTLSSGVKYYVDIAKPHNTTDNYAGSSNGATLKSENGMYYKNYVCPTNGNSVIFTGAASNRNPVAVSTSGSPSDSLSGGKYLVMKYRVNGTPSTTQLQIYSSTGTANRKNFAVTGTLPADGWRVEVIDLEAYATATNLFNDQSTHLYVAFFISNAMSSGASVDLAYMAVVDSKDAVHGLLNNGETYTMRTFTVTDLSKTDAGTSTLGLTYDKNGVRTYEKYILNVDKNITPPEDNMAGVTPDYTKSDSDGTTFARFSTDAASTSIRIRIRNNQTVGKTARYLVLKWRVQNNDAGATIGLLAGSNGYHYDGYGNRPLSASDEWIVEVIDLQRAVDNSKYTLDQYDVGATFTLSVKGITIANQKLTVDVAYAALVDSLENVPEIVNGEDYTVKTGGTVANTEWLMTGTKYNADGTLATPAQ